MLEFGAHFKMFNYSLPTQLFIAQLFPVASYFTGTFNWIVARNATIHTLTVMSEISHFKIFVVPKAQKQKFVGMSDHFKYGETGPHEKWLKFKKMKLIVQ